MFLNLNNKEYYYKQVYDNIRDQIITNKLKPGSKLPSIRKLSLETKLSVNTITNAYYQLEKEGYIRAKEKSGFYVEKIDQLLILNKNNSTFDKEEEETTQFKYDFSFSGVDNSCFNYKEMKKAFKDAINDENSKLLNSNTGPGCISLRKAISDYLLSSRGIDVSYKQILVSSGSSELLKIVRNILPDQIFGFENPGYAYQGFGFYQDFNCEPINFSYNGVNINQLNKKNISLVAVTPSHQFPTSIIMPINKRIELLNWAYQKEDRFIIEDDYDGEFKYNFRPISPLKTLDSNDKVIYIGNFSRTVTPALRVSFMVLPHRFLKLSHDYIINYKNPVSIFVQLALSNFINSDSLEKQVNQMKKLYKKKYDLILEMLSKNKKISVISTDSGTSIVIKIKKLRDANAFLKSLADNHVKILPIKDFYFDKAGPDNEFLLGFAKLDFTQIETGLTILLNTIDKFS